MKRTCTYGGCGDPRLPGIKDCTPDCFICTTCKCCHDCHPLMGM